MKYINKIIKQFKFIFFSLYCLGFLRSEVVVTEFFIESAEGTDIPQYIELYNTSNTDTVDLLDWSIETWLISDDCVEGCGACGCSDDYKKTSGSTIFNSSNSFAEYAGQNSLLDNQTLKINPSSYFLISSYEGNNNFYNNNNSDIELQFTLYKVGEINSFFGEIKGGKIILLDDSSGGIDTVEFNIDDGWPIADSQGHSIRFHTVPDSMKNDDPENWSLSPITENSLWLYDANSAILNFGSPREENSFRLQDIKYSDTWFTDVAYAEGDTHTVYGDYNNFYRAEPFLDDNNNGTWDFGEEFHDRNGSNSWDHQDNNYDSQLIFSWYGTFIDTTVLYTPDLNYEIIIKKNGNTITNTLFDSLNTAISISPYNLLINSLGIGREITEYSWTVQLTKTFSNDSTDTIYSDESSFTIDASDFGRYGCVDDGSCIAASDCPTNAYYEMPYSSIHPTGCTPSVNCYSALNYYEDANINSNTCHYASISLPAFVTGAADSITSLPVYLHNDSSAVVDSLFYVLTVGDTSIINSFYNYNVTFPNYLNPYLVSDTTYQKGDSIYVEMNLDSSIDSIRGIISYVNFHLANTSDSTGLSFASAVIQGGTPSNNILNIVQVPVQSGDLVILKHNYKIWGNVVYYSGDDPYKIPNVEASLYKYNGVYTDIIYSDTTNELGYYNFDLLTDGFYNLTFSKDNAYDSSCPLPDIQYVDHNDVVETAQHVTGHTPLDDSLKLIAADVTLDGTISGMDASLIAQYKVDLIDNLNELNTHWIFKPSADSTLASLYAHLFEDNGEYVIEYSPLVFDDIDRDIYAYRLGDVTGNYCSDPNSGGRSKSGKLIINDIITSYKSQLSISITVSEPIYIEGIYIEIGYDDEIFNPLSFTFDPSSIFSEHYESISNLYSHDGTIKVVIWSTDASQLIDGLIGEVSFIWEDENIGGQIWLENIMINDTADNGGITLSGYDSGVISDGLNIINELYPAEISLEQNYPNPFNPTTNISWTMPSAGNVSIEIYNIKGQLIDVLYNGFNKAGNHEIIWNASNYSSGIYFYRLTFNKTVLQKNMILLR